MRRLICVAVIMAFVIGGAAVSFAQSPDKTNSPETHKEMMKGGMKGMCPMHGMMMGKGIVATQDGGVVVMRGNKLSKYDKDLNLVKEAEIKMDTEGMQKMMMEMKEKCSMCHEMMERHGMKGESGEEQKEKAAKQI